MKNINIPVSDDLIPRMEELKRFCNVNWSAIARDGIEQYIKQRNTDSVYIKIKRKTKDFRSGFFFIIKSIDDFDLKTIEDIADNKFSENSKNKEFNKGMREAAKELFFRSSENCYNYH